MHRLALVSATLALLLTACAGETGQPGETVPATDSTRPGLETPDTTEPGDGGANGEVPQEMLDELVQQASADTGISEDEITAVTAEAVTWSDGSLGCPEPGMSYTQALVPGYRVVLDVAGEEIHYHAGSDGEFFACDDPQPPIAGDQ